jgi:hypothetical protein
VEEERGELIRRKVKGKREDEWSAVFHPPSPFTPLTFPLFPF